MQYRQTIKPDNLDILFQKLADTYLQIGGKNKVIFTVVGGASLMIGYSFRKSTIDIDAFFASNTILNNAISIVAKEENLPEDWINSEFTRTPSYSAKLVDVAQFYKLYNDILEVRYVYGKYLIAMKIKSSRPTTSDLDDIIKMIYQMRIEGKISSFEEVTSAFDYLYSSNYDNVYSFILDEACNAFTVSDEIMNDIINPSIFNQ